MPKKKDETSNLSFIQFRLSLEQYRNAGITSLKGIAEHSLAGEFKFTIHFLKSIIFSLRYLNDKNITLLVDENNFLDINLSAFRTLDGNRIEPTDKIIFVSKRKISTIQLKHLMESFQLLSASTQEEFSPTLYAYTLSYSGVTNLNVGLESIVTKYELKNLLDDLRALCDRAHEPLVQKFLIENGHKTLSNGLIIALHQVLGKADPQLESALSTDQISNLDQDAELSARKKRKSRVSESDIANQSAEKKQKNTQNKRPSLADLSLEKFLQLFKEARDSVNNINKFTDIYCAKYFKNTKNIKCSFQAMRAVLNSLNYKVNGQLQPIGMKILDIPVDNIFTLCGDPVLSNDKIGSILKMQRLISLKVLHTVYTDLVKKEAMNNNVRLKAHVFVNYLGFTTTNNMQLYLSRFRLNYSVQDLMNDLMPFLHVSDADMVLKFGLNHTAPLSSDGLESLVRESAALRASTNIPILMIDDVIEFGSDSTIGYEIGIASDTTVGDEIGNANDSVVSDEALFDIYQAFVGDSLVYENLNFDAHGDVVDKALQESQFYFSQSNQITQSPLAQYSIFKQSDEPSLDDSNNNDYPFGPF